MLKNSHTDHSLNMRILKILEDIRSPLQRHRQPSTLKYAVIGLCCFSTLLAGTDVAAEPIESGATTAEGAALAKAVYTQDSSADAVFVGSMRLTSRRGPDRVRELTTYRRQDAAGEGQDAHPGIGARTPRAALSVDVQVVRRGERRVVRRDEGRLQRILLGYKA